MSSPLYSSVGRARDCKWFSAVIPRSLVRIQLERLIFNKLNINCK